MRNEQYQLLASLNDETLKIIKEEAEMCIQNQVDSENIIVNKATGMFQLFIAIFISVLGYYITQEDIQSKSNLFCAGITFESFLALSIVFLIIVIYPKIVFAKGVSPEKILENDILNGNCANEKLKNLYVSRIINLNSSIEKNRVIQSKRVNFYIYSIYSI